MINKVVLKTLSYSKHQIDFFLADEVELSSFRDEITSMEHPFFALKSGDTKARKYKNGKVTIVIKPSSDGLATIFDKDLWIYAISKLQEAINNNEITNRTIVFTPYDFFITTNRSNGGKNYELLEKSLSRLAGTRIETNVVYSEDFRKTENFGLIDKWVMGGKKRGKLFIGTIEITLPDWLYQSLYKKKY